MVEEAFCLAVSRDRGAIDGLRAAAIRRVEAEPASSFDYAGAIGMAALAGSASQSLTP